MNVLLSGTNYKSQKSENRGQMTETYEFGIRNAECGIVQDRNQKAETYEFGMRDAECGIVQDRSLKAKDSGQKPPTINDLYDPKDQNYLNELQRADSIGQSPEIVSPQQSKPSHRTYEHKNPMNRNKNKNQDVIADALKVVQEGLKSMQHLQSQTAMAHQAQTEANRSLKEMMKNAQRLTERSLSIDAEPGQPPPTPQYRLEPPPEPELPKNDITPTINHHSSHPATAATTRDTDEIPSQPVAHKLTEGAANGYSQDDHDHDLQIEKTNQSHQAFEEIESTMLEVVSQLTGYPEEMLGLDMDIEAELGIDSIKRVEILSTLEEKMPDLPAVSPEIIGSLKTLGQIAEFLSATAEGKKAENHSKMSVGTGKNTFVEKTHSAAENMPTEITSMMLEVVSQLTGYPQEMLGMDMDIEAELGIDSIKRVEILSTLEEKMPDLPAVSPEIMGTLKTLGQIADYLTKPTTPEIPRESIDEGTLTVSAALYGGPELSDNTPQRLPDPNPPDISRNVVTVVDAPGISETPIKIAESKKVLVTEDNTGLAGEIARELEKVGISSVRISLDNLRSKKRLPDAAGLVIVQDPGSPKMAQDLKDAFTLTKHMAANLINSASDGGALFATVTRLDGAFGFKQTKAGNPLQGGLAGLVKTAAIEWQDVCCHAIDIAPDWSDHCKIAEAVVREIMIPGPVEIGLDARYRCVLALEPRPFPAGRINLEKGDVIVISGGARGITAAAALELANHDKLKLVLLGRSPNPVDEPDWLSAIEGDAAIKKAILKNEYKNQTATPVEIEKAFKRYMANREIAENLAELKSTGSDAVYYSVDVRNSENVQATMDDIRLNHGPIAGIIHGAGVLEDRLIIDKTLNQFERVFDTKVMGLDNLLHATRNNPLKYLVIFSSIAARMGNKGQVDYAMANEALNKIALAASLHRPECRVVAINWGPWDGGMVTSALKGEFERNGIDLIPTHDGAKCMVYEMMADKDDPVEVVIGAEMTSLNLDVRSELQRPALVRTSPVTKKQQLSLSFERQIDIKRYPVLESHTIDGRPVVPLALITEWLAHSALHENPGLVLQGLDDIRILKGIRLGPDKKLIRMLAGKLKKSGDFYEVDLELRGGKKAGRDIIHSRAKAILSDRLNSSPDYQFSKAMVAKAYPRNVEDVYEKILFHGAQLHGIRKIVSCSSRGMVAHISPAPEPGEWISDPLRNQWIADPLVLDSAFQMATVWCHEEKGIVSLPSYVASYRQYCHQYPTDRVTVVLEVKDATNRKMKGDFTILDADDEIVACVTGYETIMDSSLSKAFKPQYRASA
jgi:NAD(P)-dependent dehydrogenase (short-subunit alcohol dehydrogenase family)/acyl carrier protein